MTYSIGKPSQAEGDRDTIEEDLRRHEPDGAAGPATQAAPSRRRAATGDDQGYSVDKPSQAEGDRETMEENLRRRETAG
jgi:hypothetical protein